MEVIWGGDVNLRTDYMGEMERVLGQDGDEFGDAVVHLHLDLDVLDAGVYGKVH